jgi:hypothetical protein
MRTQYDQSRTILLPTPHQFYWLIKNRLEVRIICRLVARKAALEGRPSTQQPGGRGLLGKSLSALRHVVCPWLRRFMDVVAVVSRLRDCVLG